MTKRMETVYQSAQSVIREMAGIEKMLVSSGVRPNQQLVRCVFELNTKFGKYHTMEILLNTEQLLADCNDEQGKVLVNEFLEHFWDSHV